MAQPRSDNRAPGIPPFATDLPDSAYVQAPPRRRVQEPVDDPNKRSSAYNMYDPYMDGNRNSRADAIGMLMTGDMDDDDSDDEEPSARAAAHAHHAQNDRVDKHAALLAAARQPQPTQPKLPLAAPKPGYAAPVGALNLSRPKPAVLNTGRGGSPPEMSQVGYPSAPPTPNSAYSVPSTPHPLQAPQTPIMPVFARASPAPRDVKFDVGSTPIPRGNSEDTLIPKRGARGDDFWRRFSMVVREDNSKAANEKTSVWLRKTKNGTARLSRWVWIIAVFLVLCIGGGIGLGWYFTHNDSNQTVPDAVGGKASQGFTVTSTPVPGKTGAGGTTDAIVTPTKTVQRRSEPTNNVLSGIIVPHLDTHPVHVYHQRSSVNRAHHH